MRLEVILVPSAVGDLEHYTKRHQRIILDALAALLASDADVATRRRKPLRENPMAPWELRLGQFRVFYEVAQNSVVKVLAIGHKRHNALFVRGKRVVI